MSHCGECDIRRASEMEESLRLSTGSSKLDESLSGGLPVKGITEICGESGSGKSQICLQLALTAQLPQQLGGLHGGVIYICSEELFQSKRLHQMIQAFKEKLQTTIKFSDNIYILHVADYASLENNLRNILQLVRSRNIKLLILDSITAVFRGNLTEGGGRRRAADLRKIASNFYELNGKYGVMIVCVNQVSECFDGEKGPIPALGLAWANLVTARFQLRKEQMCRTLEVVFSPEIPQKKIQFRINECGVEAC